VYTQNQGEKAIEKLKNTYKDLRDIPLEFKLGGNWEDLFSNKVPEYYNGQFGKVSGG